MDCFQRFQHCLRENQAEQALRYLKDGLRNHPKEAEAYFQFGKYLSQHGARVQALGAFQEACRIDPGQAVYRICLGVAHQDLQQPEQAIRCYSGWEQDPKVRFNLATALLLVGRYQEGWSAYEARLAADTSGKYRWHPPERLWQGQPFPGQTLVVYSEQGRGDDIQFCRYLSYVKALGGEVVLSTWPDLIPVLATQFGVDRIVEHGGIGPRDPLRYNWAVPLMSLPYAFRTTLDDIPNQTPYLNVPTAYRAKWGELLADQIRPGVKNIGVVYACKPTNQAFRTCPLHLWQSLFSLPGLRWFSLQKGEAAVDFANCASSHPHLVDLTGHIHDFADTAALIEQLDLVISVDTAVPHLAGALGKPTWMLLPFVSDWRWLLNRCDSPWYPDFRLFRQNLPGHWEPVISQVRQALAGFPAPQI